MANLASGKIELYGVGHDVGGGVSDGLTAKGEGDFPRSGLLRASKAYSIPLGSVMSAGTGGYSWRVDLGRSGRQAYYDFTRKGGANYGGRNGRSSLLYSLLPQPPSRVQGDEGVEDVD